MTDAETAMRRFHVEMSRLSDKVKAKADKLVQGIAFEMAENIVVGGDYAPGTPVDTGFARASWWVSIGSQGAPVQAPTNPTRAQATRNAAGLDDAAILAEATVDQPIFVLSNCEYLPDLEYGSSRQAPAGMIRLTLDAGPQILAKVAAALEAA